MNIQCFDKNNLHQLRWPEAELGNLGQQALMSYMQCGIQPYISNVHTDLRLLKVDDVILPITINHYDSKNSYVCSPYNHYFAYGLEEMDKLDNRFFEALCRGIMKPFCWYYLRNGFDDVVFVNNWLLSTNLYPALSSAQTQAISDFLIKKFPDRPIIFRSVDNLGNPDLYQPLLDLNYRMVFSRQVYYQNPQDEQFWKHSQLKTDQRKLRNTRYRLLEHHEISTDEIPRLVELYRMLYLEKYSYYNPQLTEAFFASAIKHNWLRFQAFEHDGRIDAMMGYLKCNGIMTQPVFGYDTQLPQNQNLYRLLSMQVISEAQQLNHRINVSAGVGAFKRLRGGVPALEYNAVFDQHLPRSKQFKWKLLQQILDRIGVPIIQKYGF